MSTRGKRRSLLVSLDGKEMDVLRNLAERVTALEQVVQQLVTWTRMELEKGDNNLVRGSIPQLESDEGDPSNLHDPPMTNNGVTPFRKKYSSVAKKSTSGVPKNLKVVENKKHPDVCTTGQDYSGLDYVHQEDDDEFDIQVKFEPLDFPEIYPDRKSEGCDFFEENDEDFLVLPDPVRLGEESSPENTVLFNPVGEKKSPENMDHFEDDDDDYAPQDDIFEEEDDESGSDCSHNLRRKRKNKISPKNNKTLISIIPLSQPEVTLPNPYIRLGPKLTLDQLASQNCSKVVKTMKKTPKNRKRPAPRLGFRFKCDHCSYGSNFKRKYLHHYHHHTGERPYLCATCGKGFDLLKSHEKCCTNGMKKSHSCPVEGCSEAFKLKASLQRHVKKMHKDSRRKCDICQGIFSGPQTLYLHKKRMHQDRTYICPMCGHKFVFSHELKIHVALHSNPKHTFRSRTWRVGPVEQEEEEASAVPQLDTDKIYVVPPTFVCSVEGCGKSYRREVLLQSHVKARHWTEEERKVGCQVCGKILKDYNHLQGHMRIVHSDERAHVCAICGQAFKTRSHLTRHESGHANPNWKPRSNCKPKKYEKKEKETQKSHELDLPQESGASCEMGVEDGSDN